MIFTRPFDISDLGLPSGGDGERLVSRGGDIELAHAIFLGDEGIAVASRREHDVFHRRLAAIYAFVASAPVCRHRRRSP